MDRKFSLLPYFFLLVMGITLSLVIMRPAQTQPASSPALKTVTSTINSADKSLATSVTLQAMKAAPAPINTTDTSVALGKANSDKTQAVPQYILSLPCEGWRTTSIILTGQIKPQAAQPAMDNFNSSIDQDLLTEYGCQLKAKRILMRGQRKIIIDAYRFATARGAYGAYCAARRGSSSYLTRGTASSEDQDSISFCKNCYFIYMYSTEKDDGEAKDTITVLANKIDDYIQKTMTKNTSIPAVDAQPEIFNSMPVLERVRGSEKLVMGPIGLKKFFPAPYTTNLFSLVEGTIADYKFEEPDRDRLKLLIASYPSAQAASLVFANYSSTLRSMHKEKPAEGFVSPTVIFKLSDCFILCQLRDKQVVVINGAKHKDSLSLLAHQIYF